MLSKLNMAKLFSQTHLQKHPKINPLRHVLLCNPLCTTTESPSTAESPELPSWIKFFDTKSPDEDFVIPSLASWVEGYKLGDQTSICGHVLTAKAETDVDQISELLKKKYPSPDKVAQALNGCCASVPNNLVEKLLRRFSNDWISAFGFFFWAKTQTGYTPTPETYNSIVDVLGKYKKFSLMWEIVKEMNDLKNGYVTLATVTTIMRRLARGGKYDDAIEVFRGIENFGVAKDVAAMNALMDALVKNKSVEHAYKVFLEFKDQISLNSMTFNVLIHGWCKARMLEDARKAMDAMVLHGFSPDVASYSSLIEHYCLEKDFCKVDDVLKEMRGKGCKPNVITYTIIVHGLGKAKESNEVLKVYETMKSEGCLPDAPFYSSLIFNLSKAGRLKDANEIFDDMQKLGVTPDIFTYNTMIVSACARSEEEAALKLLQKMEKDSCKPDLQTYAPLLKMCCRKKRMKVLNFLLTHMLKHDLSADGSTYHILVNGLCQSGKLEQACLFFEEMVSKGMVPRDSLCKTLGVELEKKSLGQEKERIEKLQTEAKEQKPQSPFTNS